MTSDVETPPGAGGTFRFTEAEGPNGGAGRTISFADVDIQPRSYAELVGASPNLPVTIPLDMYNGQVLHTDFDGVSPGEMVHVNTTLQSRFTSRAIGLVKGGWMPSALATIKSNSIILIDRNVMTEIVSRFEGGVKKGREPDFLDLFEDSPIRVNPLLCALEGNSRRIPDSDEARAQIDEAVSKLRRALPKAEIVVGAKSLEGVLGLIEDTRASFGRKNAMLLELAPALCAPTSSKRVAACIASVIDAADRFDVPRQSLLVFAIASSIAVPNGRSPAFTLLNLRPGYSREDAYNALSDLRSLEILIHIFALFPRETVQLCTADRDLALLWCGIQASDFQVIGRGVVFEITPVEALLPRGALEIWHSAVSTNPIS
ncbi:hypothetical protein NKI38_27975 [Mesorhizobium sp. M0621]|uniref:hypothetical protein n=1 Tax=Mesorhizobium sp. M0621 TaxID=2956974 RepID=UPI003338C027